MGYDRLQSLFFIYRNLKEGLTKVENCGTVVPINNTRGLKMVKYRVVINPRSQWDTEARKAKVSPRELEVLALVADGADNIQIAGLLEIKYQTVKNHLHKVVKKLGASNVTAAFMLALAKGLIRVTTEDAEPSEKWRGFSYRSGGGSQENE